MRKSVRVIAGLAGAVLLAVSLLAAADTASASAPDDVLLSVRHLATETPQQVAANLRSSQFDASAVRYGVDTYQLVYRTVDAEHQPTVASGLLVLPTNDNRELRTVSFTHGTEVYKFDVPSMQDSGFLPGPALTYGSAGFAAVAPDYLGLGISPGTHPWMDVASETTAALDMLRAARTFAASKGRSLDRQVLVTGFSQGASAALGLARALQSEADPWFRLGALAPISGAYEFRRDEIPALLSGRLDTKSSALYSAYLLVAWNRLHHLYDSPGQMFQHPYDTTVEQLFDTTVPGPQVFQGTPDTVQELLTPQALSLLRNPTGAFADALRVADSVCSGWSPKAPTRLYMMAGDEQAANSNTVDCQAGLGAPIVKVGPGSYEGSEHLGSNVLATADIVRWFETLS